MKALHKTRVSYIDSFCLKLALLFMAKIITNNLLSLLSKLIALQYPLNNLSLLGLGINVIINIMGNSPICIASTNTNNIERVKVLKKKSYKSSVLCRHHLETDYLLSC